MCAMCIQKNQGKKTYKQRNCRLKYATYVPHFKRHKVNRIRPKIFALKHMAFEIYQSMQFTISELCIISNLISLFRNVDFAQALVSFRI